VRRLRVAPQALAVFSEQVLERRVVQHRFSQQLLKPSVAAADGVKIGIEIFLGVV
jgi:hypothetical protein